ncbi:hypothetical protein Tco_0996812 [Tanacetum coccineum]
MDKSKSYLAGPKHRECYEGLIKSYDLDKTLFSTYGKVYSLKRSQKDKDKDEDPSAGSDRGLKKRKTSKDAEPTKGPTTKESKSGLSKGIKSQTKSSEGNLGNDDEEPTKKVASKRDWFTKPKQPQEPTDPDWNEGKTLQQGPTQSWLMTLAASTDKSLKSFDELMSTPIDFSAYIMNGLKITNLTQETLLGPAFRLLKGTRTSYAELEYDFEECYKALSEKLDWENPEGGDYPFDLTKPLPLVMSGNRQKVPVDYFFNNDLKYLQGGISTMTYTTSTTKTKAAQYDLPGIEDMVPNIWSPVKVSYDKHALWGISHWREQRKTFYGYARGLQSTHDVYSTKRILAVTHVEVMRKHGYGYLKEIVVRRADNDLYRFKEGDFLRLRINDIEDMLLLVVQNRLTNLSGDDKKINVTKPETTRPNLKKRHPYTPYQDPQVFIYVDNQERNRLMRSDELYKFSDGTLIRLLTSLEDITKNIHMEYLPKRRWSSLEKKRAHIMIKEYIKMDVERQSVKVKELQERCIIKAFKLSYQEKYEHIAQDVKYKFKEQAQSKKSTITTTYSQEKITSILHGGYDWSDQAEEGPNYALVAYSSLSSVSKDMSYHHHSSVSSARRFNVSGDMLFIPSLSIKKLNLSRGNGLVKMSAS